MKGVLYLVGVFLLGYVQGDVISRRSQPVFIEDIRRASPRVVGGWPATEGQIPHQGSLRMVSITGGVSSCGCSLIHHQWAITAAHCLANRITFVVRFGLTDLAQPEYIGESTNKYIHPRYNEQAAGVQTDDIGLLGLNHYIPYTPNIQPCRLQNSAQKNTDYDGVVFTVSGFGRTDDLWNGGAASDILLWTYLRGITTEACLSWYPNSQVIKEQTVCAQYYNDTSQSSCQGDSGGPLTLVDLDGKPTMIGIVSFGPAVGCNSPNPAGYVRPGHYHDWYVDVTGISFDWSDDDLEVNPPDLPDLPDLPDPDLVNVVDP